MSSVLDLARKYVAAGISVLPIKPDGSKTPAPEGLIEGKWKYLQERAMSDEELVRAFAGGNGIAAICGGISGNLEDFDFDDEQTFHDWKALVVEHLGQGFWDALLVVQTPRPGFAVIVRCRGRVGASQKLASELNCLYGLADQPKYICLVETKAEGGYFLLPGCPAACHPTGRTYEIIQGDFDHIPDMSGELREVLITCARSFDQKAREEFASKSAPLPTIEGEISPGDDYRHRGPAWEEILQPHGYKLHSQRGDVSHWTRPGKEHGVSASTNHNGSDLFYPFSSNCHPFDSGRGYNKFAVYALLNHAGDFSAAARQLSQEEYGNRPKSPTWLELMAEAGIVPNEADVFAGAKALAQVMHAPTEDNVARLFEQRHGDALRYCKTWNSWLVWDGARWRADHTDLALDFCRHLAREVNTQSKSAIAKKSFASGVESFARAARCFATEPEQWDRDVFLLNTPDGVEELNPNEIA